MQFKYIAAILLSASAVLATPAERRQNPDLGDIITSAIVEGATSVFGDATSLASRATSAIGEGATSVFGDVTSLVSGAPSAIGEGATSLLSRANSLASSATSAVGAEITGQDDGAARGSFQAQQALFVGAATVVGSAFLGAFIAL